MSPPAPLFRPEVMQASQTQWLGSIRISRPPWFGWVTLIALTLAITLVVFSVWGQVTRKAKLPGVLMPQEGLIQVAAPQTGVVSELLVQEGQQVEVGQVLLRISSQRHLSSGGEASELNAQALAQRRAALQTEQMLVRQQAQQRQNSLNDRLRSLHKEEQQARGELDTIQLHNLTVNAYGRPQARKAGMALEADVIQDRRAVWEWLMELVLAAREQLKVMGARNTEL